MNTENPNPDISLITVANEKDLERYNLDQLAHELTGQPVMRLFPIYVVFYRGRCRGYFQVPTRPVVYPTIHPELMGAKEYHTIMSGLAKEIKRATGNPLFLLCERARKMSEKTLLRFGVKKCPETAYEYYETP